MAAPRRRLEPERKLCLLLAGRRIACPPPPWGRFCHFLLFAAGRLDAGCGGASRVDGEPGAATAGPGGGSSSLAEGRAAPAVVFLRCSCSVCSALRARSWVRWRRDS